MTLKELILRNTTFTEKKNLCTIKPTFSTLDNVLETFRQEPITNFIPDDISRDVLDLKPDTLHEKCNLSHNPVDFRDAQIFYQVKASMIMTLNEVKTLTSHH